MRILILGAGSFAGQALFSDMLRKGYDVYGIIRRSSVTENQRSRIDHISKLLNLD